MMDRWFLGMAVLDERTHRIARRLDAFCREELIGVGTDHDESEAALDRTCREIARSLGQAGFLSHCVVEAPGGAFDVRRLCLGREILAAHRGLADFVFAMQGLGTGPISLFGPKSSASVICRP